MQFFWQIFEVGGKKCVGVSPPPPPTHTHTHTHTHPLATFSGLAQKFMARAAVARHFGNFAPLPQANILAPPLALPHYGNNSSPHPPTPLTVVFRASAVLSETFCPDCGSVVASLPWCGMVVVFMVRWQYMLQDRVGLNVVGWGWGKRWDTSYTAQPISIVINHKFIRPLAISMLGDFSLSQIGQPNLAQPNFQTLYKSGQCSPKHELFSDFLVSYYRWNLQPSIHMKIFRKCFTFFIWQTIQKCQLFFWDTRYMLHYQGHFLLFPLIPNTWWYLNAWLKEMI